LAIKDFIKNSPINTLYHKSKEMLLDVEEFADVDFKFSISQHFDKALFVKVMKPYLELYLITVHSMDNFHSNSCLDELKYKLKLLYTNNPKFGRKITRTISGFNNEKNKVHTFSSDYTPYRYGNMTDNYEDCHYYDGFVDDVEYRLDDDIFETTRNSRITRERAYGLLPEHRENDSISQTTTPSSQRRRIIGYNQSYNFIDSDAEERMEDDNDTITVSSIDSTDQQNDIALHEDEDEDDTTIIIDNNGDVSINDGGELTIGCLQTDIDDDMSVNDGGELTIDCLRTDNDCQEIEEEEITEEISIDRIDELTKLTAQIRELVNDSNILILDGNERLSSLLTQIDNLPSDN
jgi:hypothetical protein